MTAKPKISWCVRVFGFVLLVTWLTLAWVWSRSIDHSIWFGVELGGKTLRVNSLWGITRFEAADRSDLAAGRFKFTGDTWAWGPADLGAFARLSATVPRWSGLISTNSRGFEMGTAWVATFLLLPTIFYMHLKRKSTPGAAGRPENVCPKCGAALPAAGQPCSICVTKNPDESDSSGQRMPIVITPNFGVSK